MLRSAERLGEDVGKLRRRLHPLRDIGGKIRTGSKLEDVGSGPGGLGGRGSGASDRSVEDPTPKTGSRPVALSRSARGGSEQARWRVAGGGARAPDRMISARVTLRGGYKKCRLQ